jgi:hypothetical protein
MVRKGSTWQMLLFRLQRGVDIGKYQRFGCTYYLHLQGGRWRQYAPRNRLYLLTILDGVKFTKLRATLHHRWDFKSHTIITVLTSLMKIEEIFVDIIFTYLN